VAGIKQPQLHQLVRLDVCNELNTGVFQGRPAISETIL
jgi:hypothetical protein